MASYKTGKSDVCKYVRNNFPKGATALDVGACDGIWQQLLGDHLVMDAVEIYEPNAERLKGYRAVYNTDIVDYKFEWYDLIIFGDVIEHMEVPDAQRVIQYAYLRCTDMIVAVPYNYKQDELYGNKYEAHIQDDLTPEIFKERYPGLRALFDFNIYAYYHKG